MSVIRVGRPSAGHSTISTDDGPLWALIQGDCLERMRRLKAGSVDLVVTSPPYGIATKYARKSTLKEYLEWIRPIIAECVRVCAPTGAIAFQVGTYVHRQEIFPLDMELNPLFRAHGLHLRNRVVWRFGHGLPAKVRLSGRHETVMWWTKSDKYTFELDAVRVPQKEPGKLGYRGKKRGRLSGNPLGKNPEDVWVDLVAHELDVGLIEHCPNVKGSHVEKLRWPSGEAVHPCQMPVELCQRCVLAWSRPGDVVLDPFAGLGSTLIAAIMHGRIAFGLELRQDYVEVGRRRIKEFLAGRLRVRPLGQRIQERSASAASSQLPAGWQEAREEAQQQ